MFLRFFNGATARYVPYFPSSPPVKPLSLLPPQLEFLPSSFTNTYTSGGPGAESFFPRSWARLCSPNQFLYPPFLSQILHCLDSLICLASGNPPLLFPQRFAISPFILSHCGGHTFKAQNHAFSNKRNLVCFLSLFPSDRYFLLRIFPYPQP